MPGAAGSYSPSGSVHKPQAARDFTTPTITCWGDRTFDPHADQLSTKMVARWLPAVSLKLVGKIVVVVLECVMLGFAIYGCTKVYQDFNFRELFVPQGNWLFKAFQIENRYFGGEQEPVAIYTRAPLDGRDYFYYQDQLAAIGPALAADSYIADTPRPVSWYDEFIVWLSRPASPYLGQLTPLGRPPNATAFNAWLNTYLTTDGRYLKTKVLFNETTGSIFSSRFDAFSNNVVDGEWAIRLVDSTRDIAEETAAGLDAIAFGFSFTFYDGFRVIVSNTVYNVIIAASAVFVVMLVLLGDFLASCAVLLMVVLADVGVLGSMHYFGLTFNSVTCIVLLLAVGISVDYSAHIMRAFLTAVGTRQQRAHKALAEIGGAVWNGAFTTFLAILPMAFAQHYIFTTIFKMFGVLILLSIWHGIVLLPVLLSWCGPPSYRDLVNPLKPRHRAEGGANAV